MSELKFTCPVCGQHMECEKAYCGDQTKCLNCEAELRIPFTNTPPEPQTLLPRAELIAKRTQEVASQIDEILDKIRPKQNAVEQPAGTAAPPNTTPELPLGDNELHCICPVCQSELQLSEERIPKSANTPQMARLVRKNSEPPTHPRSIPQAISETTQAASTISEREEKIAAAREANPVQPYPTVKPRMAYILNGGSLTEPAAEPQPLSPKAEPDSSPDPFAE